MIEALDLGLPWWGWFFFAVGVLAFFGVAGALFFPDWPTPDYSL